jgi:hypothetical protein
MLLGTTSRRQMGGDISSKLILSVYWVFSVLDMTNEALGWWLKKAG